MELFECYWQFACCVLGDEDPSERDLRIKTAGWMWMGPGETPFDDCYTWRKIVKRHEIWSKLPPELVEEIAKYCRHPDWKIP